MKLGKVFGFLFLLALLGFALIQLIPYGRDHTNPPVVQEPNWDAQTRAIAKRACFDCHSNETVWTWYSNIAPVSWLVQRNVDKGRDELNFSEWETGEDEAEDIAEVIQEGEMPLPIYLIMHPEARLSEAEKAQLINGLQNAISD
jgi:hypothetical protein